jgi:hypothetical protein
MEEDRYHRDGRSPDLSILPPATRNVAFGKFSKKVGKWGTTRTRKNN